MSHINDVVKDWLSPPGVAAPPHLPALLVLLSLVFILMFIYVLMRKTNNHEATVQNPHSSRLQFLDRV